MVWAGVTPEPPQESGGLGPASLQRALPEGKPDFWNVCVETGEAPPWVCVCVGGGQGQGS